MAFLQITALLLDAFHRQYAQHFFSFFTPLVRPLGLLFVAVYIFNHAVFDYTIYVEIIITTYGSCSATFASLKRHAFNFKLRVRVLIGYLLLRSLSANVGAMLIILVVSFLYPVLADLTSGL